MIEKLLAAHAAGRLTFHGAHAALVNTEAFAAHLAPLKRLTAAGGIVQRKVFAC